MYISFLSEKTKRQSQSAGGESIANFSHLGSFLWLIWWVFGVFGVLVLSVHALFLGKLLLLSLLVVLGQVTALTKTVWIMKSVFVLALWGHLLLSLPVQCTAVWHQPITLLEFAELALRQLTNPVKQWVVAQFIQIKRLRHQLRWQLASINLHW